MLVKGILFAVTISLVHAVIVLPPCRIDANCNHGRCNPTGNCTCSPGFVTFREQYCNYQQKDKLSAFLLSFFIGFFGADWFYLAHGNCIYITIGMVKLLITLGSVLFVTVLACLGLFSSERHKNAKQVCWISVIASVAIIALWWLVDWFRIVANSFKDGNFVDLESW